MIECIAFGLRLLFRRIRGSSLQILKSGLLIESDGSDANLAAAQKEVQPVGRYRESIRRSTGFLELFPLAIGHSVTEW